MEEATVKEFSPDGVTGNGNPEDMFYKYELSGPDGARFWLLLEDHHTKEDQARAKSYLRNNFDVTKIDFVRNNEYKNVKANG